VTIEIFRAAVESCCRPHSVGGKYHHATPPVARKTFTVLPSPPVIFGDNPYTGIFAEFSRDVVEGAVLLEGIFQDRLHIFWVNSRRLGSVFAHFLGQLPQLGRRAGKAFNWVSCR